MAQWLQILVTVTSFFTFIGCVANPNSRPLTEGETTWSRTKVDAENANPGSDDFKARRDSKFKNIKNKLYKVSSEKGDSYVLGTIHSGVALHQFNTDIEALIKDSRVVLPEIDYSLEQLETYKKDPFRVIFQTSPWNEKSDLDVATIQKLVSLGFPQYMAERLNDNSCMALQTLSMARPNQVSLDLQVLEIAHVNNLQVRALDSLELRRQARSSNDAASGACSLRQIVDTYTRAQILDSLEESLRTEVAAYKSGNPEDEAVLNSPIVTVRNQAWIQVIEAEIQQGKAFVSVGDGHLQGKNGILQLLKNQGLQIELVE